MKLPQWRYVAHRRAAHVHQSSCSSSWFLGWLSWVVNLLPPPRNHWFPFIRSYSTFISTNWYPIETQAAFQIRGSHTPTWTTKNGSFPQCIPTGQTPPSGEGRRGADEFAINLDFHIATGDDLSSSWEGCFFFNLKGGVLPPWNGGENVGGYPTF